MRFTAFWWSCSGCSWVFCAAERVSVTCGTKAAAETSTEERLRAEMWKKLQNKISQSGPKPGQHSSNTINTRQMFKVGKVLTQHLRGGASFVYLHVSFKGEVRCYSQTDAHAFPNIGP